MMEILRITKTLNLPDWWVCAGFVRSKIWDVLHDFSQRTPLSDVDVVYYNFSEISESYEKELEKSLKSLRADIPWSVKNQARMHVINNNPPYTSSVDAISKFPETVTALGVKLDENDNVILTAPCGIHDVINMEVKPPPYFMETKERMLIYEERIRKKNWQSIWNKVKVNYVMEQSVIENMRE
ncbi:nucleotidyltransferase family protein [Cytobacillus spongiae]|uniref:nucleotidyltransferase family protein n=1 Tax=Cytobacillus spongiae TaxID=2901381 RepID=UPI001F38B891|nr:nucleotidyltransferase family protein [Cytobacillus spongiae]UII56549.1 nucleotidyltransferase family protein [Cytobacillus spongiae]